MTDVYVDEIVKVKESTNLRQISYDKKTQTLFVEFLSGAVAGYRGVIESVWRQFKQYAENPGLSAGQYYNRYIRSNSSYTGISTTGLYVVVRPAAADKTGRFHISGTVTQEVSLDLDAKSLDDALLAFRARYPNVVIKEATVKFG